MTSPAFLADRYPAVTASVGAGSTVRLSSFKYGTHGGIGLQNMMPVVFEDSTPLIQNGRAYFSATLTGAGQVSANIQGQSLQLAVLSIDTQSPYSIRLESSIFVKRGSGNIVNDCVGKLLYDRDARIWRAFINEWGTWTGTEEVQTQAFVSYVNLASGVHVLENGIEMALPNAATKSHYDVSVCKVGATWYAGFTETNTLTGWTNFYPGLASSADLVTWAAIGTDQTRTPQEGTNLARIGNEVFLFGAEASTRKWHVYNLAMTYQGTIEDSDVPSGAPPSHPGILPIPTQSGGMKYLALTFDTTDYTGGSSLLWGHGNLIVLEADQTSTGRPNGLPLW